MQHKYTVVPTTDDILNWNKHSLTMVKHLFFEKYHTVPGCLALLIGSHTQKNMYGFLFASC